MSEQQKKKYSKEWYINQIKNGKSLQQIAAECGTTVLVIRDEIYGFYKNPTCAAKWIDMAAENAKTNMEKDKNVGVAENMPKQPSAEELPIWVQRALNLATKNNMAILDTSFLVKYGDLCKEIETVVIPEICIGEMLGMAEHTENLKERLRIKRKVDYWKKRAKIIKVESKDLPVLPKGDVEGEEDFKWRTWLIARFTQYMWNMYGFKVPYLTCCTRVKALIKAYVVVDNTQA